MSLTTPGQKWTEWLAANVTDTEDTDEATKLAALRELIYLDARHGVNQGDFGADWANKKLAALGISERVSVNNVYEMTVTLTGTYSAMVYGADRALAEADFRARVASGRAVAVRDYTAADDVQFISGPEDMVPGVVDEDAPATVDATLAKLREIVLLAVIAGPHVCESGANTVLSYYGLAPVPERKRYTVSRNADAVLSTTVQAYDAGSAERVASWRWANNRAGFAVTEAAATNVLTVDTEV